MKLLFLGARLAVLHVAISWFLHQFSAERRSTLTIHAATNVCIEGSSEKIKDCKYNMQTQHK